MRSEIQSHPIQQCIQCIYTAYTHIHWIQPLKPASIYLVVNFNSAQPSLNRDWGWSNLPTLAVLQYNFHFGRKSICPTCICKKQSWQDLWCPIGTWILVLFGSLPRHHHGQRSNMFFPRENFVKSHKFGSGHPDFLSGGRVLQGVSQQSC